MDSFCTLGAIYLFGEGTEKNEEKGWELLLQAADNGHGMAAWIVGKCYYDGGYVKQNFAESKKYLTIAWQNDMNIRAQNLLIEMSKNEK